MSPLKPSASVATPSGRPSEENSVSAHRRAHHLDESAEAGVILLVAGPAVARGRQPRFECLLIIPIRDRDHVVIPGIVAIGGAVPMLRTVCAGEHRLEPRERCGPRGRRVARILQAEISHHHPLDRGPMARHERRIWRLIVVRHPPVAGARGLQMRRDRGFHPALTRPLARARTATRWLPSPPVWRTPPSWSPRRSARPWSRPDGRADC